MLGNHLKKRGLNPRLKLGLMLVITGKSIMLNVKIYYCSRMLKQVWYHVNC
jgi:hypothetical protein